MDQWVQKLSHLVLMMVVGLCIYGNNREITCDTPVIFTDAQNTYAHQACSQSDAPYQIRETENWTERQWTSYIDTKSAWMLHLALVQVIVNCIAYILIDWIVASGHVDVWSMDKELHRSYFKVPLYFLIQVFCGICWVSFTIVINHDNEFPTSQSTFMCDYKVRWVGNTHRHTVQCIDGWDYPIRTAYLINYGLALVVTLTKLIHIISALLIGPFLALKTARAALMKSGAIKNPAQLGRKFAFSDLYFMMLIKGYGSHLGRAMAVPDGRNEAQKRRDEDKELVYLVGRD